MNLLRSFCGLLLILSATAAYAQGPDATAPSAAPVSKASADQEKPRSKKETRKQLEDMACGPYEIHHRRWTVEGLQTLPEQPADKALIYVIRPTHMGTAVQSKLSVDKKWVGVNRVNNYFYITVEPGPHYFCSQLGDQVSLLSLVVDAGQTYYLQQRISMAGHDLELLDADEGKKGLAKCKLSAFEEKK
jgi:hypothetical protein